MIDPRGEPIGTAHYSSTSQICLRFLSPRLETVDRAFFTARLRAAYTEAQAIRASALKEAGEEQRKLVEAARREAQQLVDSAKAQMENDVRRAREELRREVSDIAIAVAEKLVRKSLRDEDHRRIVEDSIARIGR